MNEMKLSDFNYELPQELIAQDPLLKRSDSRLMVLNRATGGIEHRHFSDVIEYLNPGDCLVINDTKVIPARLIGVKEDTGASIEVLLLKRHDDKVWETLVKPGKKARVGVRISFGEGKLVGEVIDIIKKCGAEEACRDKDLRAQLVEEMADVLMYYHDVLWCFGITEEELRESYTAKFEKNLHRW